jgi:hypothetical protein
MPLTTSPEGPAREQQRQSTAGRTDQHQPEYGSLQAPEWCRFSTTEPTREYTTLDYATIPVRVMDLVFRGFGCVVCGIGARASPRSLMGGIALMWGVAGGLVPIVW